MEYTVEISNKLNELLERTYDAEKGFKQVADKADNEVIREFFEDRAKQRYDFGHELKKEIKAFGQNPDKGGSTKGTFHRRWIDFKSLFTSNDDEAILEEVKRGEKEAIETYNDLINDTNFVLPPSTENLLMRQRNMIRETLDTANIYENAVS
ncbi:PA2169 family four-helix-bundle protein [Muricauda sp. JGD-17]|uniref:PA2169 family four-helix-bundle protein n=1 Tax=Flagellimonas ochracea TaxID=2696472 RepID=A0A964TD65_9FLAO|nr:PA2169 family four-helix-bundle protein [Allomuricauda ochracea]NAY92675.1 PA2169 family four-helix-bundle protein [Allomuricauda ochracea]